MKNTSLMIVAGMLAFAGVTQADEAKEKPKKGIDPAILEKYDADKDGKLSKEEKAKWNTDKAAEKANQPKPEKKPKEPKPVDPAILEKYDTDKDGTLSKEEATAMKKAKAAEKANQPKPEKKPKEPKPAKKPKQEVDDGAAE